LIVFLKTFGYSSPYLLSYVLHTQIIFLSINYPLMRLSLSALSLLEVAG
jgi:hypothetical protein